MTIDISKGDTIHIQFNISLISSIGSVLIQTLIGHIKFYIIKVDTLFLFCLADIDFLAVCFKNTNKMLVVKSTHILVICRFDHAFLLLESSLNSFIT